MTHPVVETIIQGDTIDLECRLPGEDLTGASVELRADTGIPLPEVFAIIQLPDTILIQSNQSNTFHVGTHRLRLHILWPNGQRETVLEVMLSIIPRLDGFFTSQSIIDGGAPETVFDLIIDGEEV